MKEKRIVGSVYCITEIDKFGKCTNGFVPILDLEISNKQTLGQKLTDLEAKNKALQKEVNILTNAFKTIIESIVGIKNETN